MCEAGDIRLAYLFGGKNPQTGQFSSPVKSKESIPLQTCVEIVFRLDFPELFMTNVFRGADQIEIPELKGRYFKELRDSLVEFLQKYSMQEINQQRDFKNKCADAIEKHLKLSLKRDGFHLIQVASISFFNPEIEELKRQCTILKIQGAKQELKIRSQRKRAPSKSQMDGTSSKRKAIGNA